MGLAQDCELYFGSKNLYDILGINKCATLADIKKAYKKASLLIHPDRVSAEKKTEATRKFQILCKVHFILADVDKRAAYDELGLIDEENSISEDDSSPEFWDQYWRNLFPKITKKDIEDFFSEYKGSEEEMKDLKECYVKYEGDMNMIAECFIGYEVDEEDRLREALNDMIDEEEIPAFPKFVKESKAKKAARIKRYKSEAKEAAQAQVKEDTNFDLLTAISRRNQERESQFNSMIQSLEAKYAGNKGTKGKKKR